jgi:hypothetical protein
MFHIRTLCESAAPHACRRRSATSTSPGAPLIRDVRARLVQCEQPGKRIVLGNIRRPSVRSCHSVIQEPRRSFMVEIAADFPMDVFQYVGVVHAIEDLFPLRVDVSNRIAQKPHVRPFAEREAVYAFK